MKFILIVFLLLMVFYLSGASSGVVMMMHLFFCLFLILYVIYGTKLKKKLLIILISIFTSSVIVYYAGSIAEKIYLSIYKPEVEISEFIEKEEYYKKSDRYEYEIQDGLNYEDFKSLKYIYTVGLITHTDQYFSDTYDVALQNKENNQILFVRWSKLSDNKIYLYFYKEKYRKVKLNGSLE